MVRYVIDDFDWKPIERLIYNSEIEYDYSSKKHYLQLAVAFDIEVTSFQQGDVKCANMYIWQMAFNGFVVYGRYWEEFIHLTYTIYSRYLLPNDVNMIIYVHNLAYEFQFMYKFFNWEKVFARKPHKVMTCTADINIVFKCSYFLSGYALSTVAKNLQTVKIEKGKDFDYRVIRNSLTELSAEELQYCENDVLIVTAFINEQINQNGGILMIPLTQTGYVRRATREACFPKDNTRMKIQYAQLMEKLTIEPVLYPQLKQAFAGGFTHANALYVQDVLEHVGSADIASSYPTVICAELFPMSKPEYIKSMSYRQYRQLSTSHCIIADITFYNLQEVDNIPDHILSESKALGLSYDERKRLRKLFLDNGRIVESDMPLTFTLTEVDFQCIERFYTFDKERIKIENVQLYEKAPLPKCIVDLTLQLYQEKTMLKGVEGKEAEYLHSKELINSLYGMMVTDINMDEIIFEPEDEDRWIIQPGNLEENISKYNTKRRRFLYYPWGIYVTSYARRNIMQAIYALGQDYIYSDTDSVKYLNPENHTDFFNWYNNQITQKLEHVCDMYGWDYSRVRPLDKNGEAHPLGVFENEGIYKRFKTLGAKRYLVETTGNKIQLTCAGVDKRRGMEYLVNNFTDPFFAFDNDLVIPGGSSGKLVSYYFDDEVEITTTDYQGHTLTEMVYSGIHMAEKDYHLNITSEFLRYISEKHLDMLGDLW